MPDMGGFRRRLADQAKQVAQQASQAGLQQIEHLSAGRPPAPSAQPDDAEDGASESDITEEVSRIRAFLASRRPPPGPVHGRWSVGIGDLLAEHPRVPSAARGLIRNLDRYGGLAITERTIEFDHDAIEWASVTEIRTRNVVEYLLSDAVIHQIDTIPLPWFPGRRRVLEALSKALLTMVAAAAREQLDRHADIRIPAEVEYRGAIRRNRQLSPGILAALVLADPAVNQCVLATAQAHGIEIRPADGDALATAAQRGDQLRAKLNGLESKLTRRHGADPNSSPPESVSTVDGSPQMAAQSAATYDLPDQGNVLIRLAHDVAGDWGAAVISAEVATIRRPDGVLAFDAARASKNFMKGPAQSLAGLLNLESMTVGVWASNAFGLMQRRSATKQIEQLCREAGVWAGVQWAIANGNRSQLRLDLLRDSLANLPDSMPGGAPFMRSELARLLRKRR